MSGIGHNGGPAMGGIAWRIHCWREARQKLLPVLPIEVIRTRVKRAAELGLDYKTYAGVRATTGRDIIAFLFSSNALRLDLDLRIPDVHGKQLQDLRQVSRLGLAQGVPAEVIAAVNRSLLEGVETAPLPYASFTQIAKALRQAMGQLPADGVVLVRSEAPWEGEWVAAGKLAAAIPASSFFGQAA